MKYLNLILMTLSFFLTLSTQAQQKELATAFGKSYENEALENYSAAIAAMKTVPTEESYEINLRLGWLNYLARNNKESILHYQKAVKLMPAATEPKWALITVYTTTENWVAIEKTYLSILTLDPKNTIANYSLGLIYYYRKDYLTAKKYFDVSLNLYPFNYNYVLMSAWTNYFLGNKNNASILFNKTLLYSPHDASALEGLELIK